MSVRFDIQTWRLEVQDAYQATYRPTGSTLVHRLLTSFVVLLLSLPFHFLYWNLQAKSAVPSKSYPEARNAEDSAQALKDSFMRNMRPDEQQAFESRLQQVQAEREILGRARVTRAEHAQRIAAQVYGGIMALLAALVVLPPLSVVWNRLGIESDARGTLTLSTWYLLPRRRTWSPGTISGATMMAKEDIRRTRRGRIVRHGWRWHVLLNGRSRPGLAPESSRFPVLADFVLERVRERPVEGHPVPAQVAEFVGIVERLARIKVLGPIIVDSSVRRRWWGPSIEHLGHVEAGRVGKYEFTQTFGSLADVPPHLKPQLERMLSRADSSAGSNAQIGGDERFVYCDSDGNERVYSSVEEMPPEVRSVFEQMRKDGPG